MDQSHAPAYRLVRRPLPAASAPRLDQAQQQVVDHEGGPLLVLAGPGTGKTTTIVAAVADRIERRGIAPERILVLTFSRKAAAELRERITARLRRTTREPLAVTFHSYAYALARREFVLAGDEPPRLLSAPEQLLEVRRMLRGEAQDGGARWPERLRPALATRGFAEEVRDLLLRAAERGLDGRGLRQLGKLRDRDDWMAAAAFLDRYAARFDLAPVPAYDYAEIVRIAAALLGREETRQRERGAYDVVLVDEYQDSDPAQESLLMALAGDGRELIAVGDPDQSIYAFRGADVRALTEFPDRFRTADGHPAPVVALRACRRSGPVLLAASRRVARRLPAPGRARRPTPGEPCQADPAATVTWFRSRRPGRRGPDPDRGQLDPGGRAGRRHAAPRPPGGRGALVVDGRPGALGDQAGAAAAAGADGGQRAGHRGRRRAAAARRAGHPAAAHAAALRAAAVRARRADRRRAALRPARRHRRPRPAPPAPVPAAAGRRRPRPKNPGNPTKPENPDDQLPASPGNGDMLAAALLDPRDLAMVPDRVAEPAKRVARLLAVARSAIKAGGSAEDVLWAIWDASGLAEQWQQVSAAGGPAGAAADRDLDAVLALFDQAAHFADSMPPGAPGLFAESLTGQEIAGDTLAERAVREDCVRILTAHRSKGLEWDVVWSRASRRRPGPTCGCADPCSASTSSPRRQARPAAGGGPGCGRGRRHAGRQAAGRGTPAVLRGGHPGPAAARRHRGGRRGH